MATSMNQPTTQQLYDDLSTALSSRDTTAALEQLDIICRVHPHHGGAWELRGLLQAQAGRPNLAVRYFEQARELGSLEVWSSRIMALQYLEIGRDKTAVGLLYTIGVSLPLATAMSRLISHDLLTLGHPELSAGVIRTALDRDRNEPLLWHELSAIQSRLGEPPLECLKSAERAILLAPQIAEFRVTAATLLIQMDQSLEAYEMVRQVVSPESIELDCECCLWRLICIFDCFDDHDRMAVCYRRLRSLSA
ncbi:tetratricopeptide repeat protein [Allorhodopirellula heiligendammensis]|uniref:Tetratricopeptide repeat protein n=1 Tax=Allorhodopirellula heiligendammensis TaxID=2714739 RepID=A0A5C6C3I2_9BACT|nr:tetratricopeptide repeat protein [Allorhodopirellula heiligendammensis]TWU18642.1 Tetratricopeptide repeat protein [Allorhodopirellula heiligendammensis]